MTLEANQHLNDKNKFCVLWQRKPFLTGTEDVGLGSRQFQK